jgi:hypothetical protein
MRRFWFTAALGLALAPLPATSLSPAKAARPGPDIVTDKAEKSCGSYGTQIDFLDSPAEAAKQAKKENKLVFILHVSGHFEDPRFT